MQVKRLTNLQQCNKLVEQWTCLAHGNIFRSHQWLTSWWHHYGSGRQLYVLQVVDSSGNTVGLAPWFVETTVRDGRVIRPLGANEVCSEYLGILATPEYAEEVVVALSQWLAEAAEGLGSAEDKWHLLRLTSVHPHDAVTKRLVEQLRASGHAVHRATDCRCWSFDLPDNWDTYLAGLSKSKRKRARQFVRRYLDNGRCEVGVVEGRKQFDVVFDKLIELHQARWVAKGETGCFADPTFTAFLREASLRLLEQEMLRLYWLDYGTQTLAIGLCYVSGTTVFSYQAGIRSASDELQSPGLVLNTAIIRDAIAQGFRRHDFLRGDERYKLEWGSKPTECEQYLIASKTPAGQIRHRAWVAGGTLKHWIKTGLHATGLV